MLAFLGIKMNLNVNIHFHVPYIVQDKRSGELLSIQVLFILRFNLNNKYENLDFSFFLISLTRELYTN